MTAHTWDEATHFCKKCGVQQGYHAEECLATANCHGMMHHLVKRQWEQGKIPPLKRFGEGDVKVVIVERFPPPESA
jgi:hypothetical protein